MGKLWILYLKSRHIKNGEDEPIKGVQDTVSPLNESQLEDFKKIIGIHNLALIVIDEISTVTPQMLAYINARLQQATGSVRPFGGISVMFVGDFIQFPPTNWYCLTQTFMTMADIAMIKQRKEKNNTAAI